MTAQVNNSPLILDDDPKEIEALSKLLDYLSESLKDIGSIKARHAVQAAKLVMLHEFCDQKIYDR